MGGGKRGTTGEAAGGKAGRRRTGDATDEPGCREPAGRESSAARPGGMALVDPWGALLAGLLVAEEPAADNPGGGREPPDPIAAARRVRRTGGPRAARTRGRDKGAAGAGGGGTSGS